MNNGRKKNERIYLRLPADLKDRIQEYAKRNHTTLSELTTRFFIKLLDEDERRRRQPVDAEQV